MAVKKKSLSNLPAKHKRTKDEVRHPYLKGNLENVLETVEKLKSLKSATGRLKSLGLYPVAMYGSLK